MENAINSILQMVTVISYDFEYTVIISMHIQASVAIRSFPKHYGGLSSVYHAAHLFQSHICTSFSSLIAHTISKAIPSLLYPRSLYLCNRWSNRQYEPGDISFLLKDQIIYSSSAPSSTRTRALNIDLSKSVELRKCSSICSFLSPFELGILGISC